VRIRSFDLCYSVLIDNIDIVAGGIPTPVFSALPTLVEATK
jgi:hypothetical protein